MIDQTLGTDSPSDAHFEALTGKIRLAVHKDGEKKVTFSAFGAGGDPRRARWIRPARLGPDVKLAASDPTVAVTADGMLQALTVKVDMGALDVLGDWDPMGVASPNRDLRVQVGGLYGQATFTEASDDIVATGVGIGAVSVDAHGQRIFDLGAEPERRAPLRRAPVRERRRPAGDAGDAALRSRPRLHLGLVASEYTTPPASYCPRRDLRRPARQRRRRGQRRGRAGDRRRSAAASRSRQGTLTISSTGAPQPVVVPAGKCLTGGATPPAGAHPVLGAFRSSTRLARSERRAAA